MAVSVRLEWRISAGTYASCKTGITVQTMEPGEALGIAAQIAVALAGFAGVVVVFRREAVHEWSGIDKLRLRLLLANSIVPLGLSMLGWLLLSIKPIPQKSGDGGVVSCW